LVVLAIKRRTAELDKRLAASAKYPPDSIFAKRTEQVKLTLTRLMEDRANLLRKMGLVAEATERDERSDIEKSLDEADMSVPLEESPDYIGPPSDAPTLYQPDE
jgi:hypothetical protein